MRAVVICDACDKMGNVLTGGAGAKNNVLICIYHKKDKDCLEVNRRFAKL